ncbi:Uu.00g133540.m01.CDS01 [Anthostomella pinea]|uniref:U3 small nucleolar RNA-associated protein 22 n=1 Tax=Anthostomella pinea TaxID=933095 RepID=A0AAI8YKV2_9PEZI|nr:Uu.00g133540.m01.CDS01 [Anthostomella pinea]
MSPTGSALVLPPLNSNWKQAAPAKIKPWECPVEPPLPPKIPAALRPTPGYARQYLYEAYEGRQIIHSVMYSDLFAQLLIPLTGRRSSAPSRRGAVTEIKGRGTSTATDSSIQPTKIAFLLKLSEQLQESSDGITARPVLENQDQDILNQAYSDIVDDTGAAFRMRIRHDREQTLLERQLEDNGSIRLLEKWFASYLLANHAADEVVDLMAVRPGNGELKQQVSAVRTRFQAWRKLVPSLGGTKVIAGRMTALAKAAVAEIDARRLELEPASLFASPLSDYPLVLARSIGKKRKGIANGTAFKNLELATLHDESIVSFDASRLSLEKFESLYGSAVLFFSGGNERPVIPGLESPQTAPTRWKVNLAYSTIPSKLFTGDEVPAGINKDAILAGMARIEGNSIEKIEANGHHSAACKAIPASSYEAVVAT